MINKLKLLSVLCTIGLNLQSFAQTGMDFDGDDDYVSVPDASSMIAGSEQISLSLWVYPENEAAGWPDFDGFAGLRNDSDGDFYVMQLGGTTVEARFRNEEGTNYDIVYSDLELNTWNHFVLTYDGSELILYHNGVNVGAIAASGIISNTTTALDIGRTYFVDGYSFNLDGRLDHIGLWSTAFSEEEVNELYDEVCGYDISLPELVLSYEFTEGTIGADNTTLEGLVDGKENIDGTFMGLTLDGESSNYADGITGARTSSIDASFCGEYTVPSGDETYTEPGIYKDTLTSVIGCDSIMTITLVTGNTTASIDEMFCGEYTVPSGDETYTEPGVYEDIIPNAAGCDSIITITLEEAITTSSIEETFCGEYTVPSGDETYTEPGVYVDVIPNAAGCDSIITITLEEAITTSSIDETACLTYTVPSGDEMYETSGIYTDTLTNAMGCDSIITIDLTILEVNTGVTVEEDTLTAVETEGTYQWIDCSDLSEIEGATGQSFTPEDNGDYALVMTTDGCADTSDCQTITIWVAGIDTEVLDEVSIYPNPLKDNLTINLNSNVPFVTVTISNIAGQAVLEQSFTNTGELLIVSLENEPGGIYFVHLNTGENTKTIKVVKE